MQFSFKEEIYAILNPVGYILKEMIIAGVGVIPMVFTIAGLICFILTMAMGSRTPYFWGIGMWAMSAVMKAMVSHLGL